MSVNNFDIVSKVIDKKKPFFFPERNSIVCRFNTTYFYYLEASRYNTNTQERDYYLLLSKNNFDENCRKINNDNYGRAIIRLHNDLLDYIKKEHKERVNFNVEYLESTEDYDIYSVE